MYCIKKKQATTVNRIETQFPMFKAFCTWASFASLFVTFTKKVPIIEAKIPTPAITIGKRMGPMPLKASV